MEKKKSFHELISQQDTPVLVDFHAQWCGPCHTLSPILKEISAELNGKIKVIKVDIDKNQQAAMKYSVRAVPTMIVFKKGEILWRQSGVLPKHEIKLAISKFI